MYIQQGNILTDFDEDTEAFIAAAGLNNDANLNVAGLYTAEQARMAIHQYVSLLKGTYVDGSTTVRVWDAIDVFIPAVGGTVATVKLNLKNPVDSDAAGRLIFLNRTLIDVPSVADADTLLTGKGISGFAKVGNLLMDNSYLSNLTLYSYISTYTSGSQAAIFGGGSLGELNVTSPALFIQGGLATSFGTYGSTSIPYLGGMGYSTNTLNGNAIPATVLNNIKPPFGFANANMAPNGRQIRLNHSSSNTSASVYFQISVQAQNSIMIGKYIGNQALQKINHGINFINRELNRGV